LRAGDVAADLAMYGQRVLDGKRGRKQPKRKCVDFNSTFLRHLHQRVLFRDYRDLPDMQPSLVTAESTCIPCCLRAGWARL
jgi:hypothetical protein